VREFVLNINKIETIEAMRKIGGFLLKLNMPLTIFVANIIKSRHCYESEIFRNFVEIKKIVE